MKILISSHAFLPSVGGLENVSMMLAEEFVRAGHEVKLVTQTPSTEDCALPYSVIRRPRPSTLLKLLRWCDTYFHNSISLRTAWPLLLVRRPWVVAHQTWIPRGAGGGWAGRLKQYVLARSTNVSISNAIAAELRAPSVVIGNPYDDSVFRDLPGVARDRELVFCGRLIDDKGADILLEALGILRQRGPVPSLTIIGGGPEEQKLRAMVGPLTLDGQVRFAGVKKGHELACCLNAHRIMVVPSRWREPFGIVALEGIASGCVAVGSEGGGLKDAIGPCGVTFRNGDAAALAARLEELLASPQSIARYRANAAAHLRGYTRAAVADRYLRVFAGAVRRRPRARLCAGDACEAKVVYGLED
jgi:glycosyltransferase involved in cell wall biosynthesis